MGAFLERWEHGSLIPGAWPAQRLLLLRVCHGEQSCSMAVSQGRSLPGERCPQGMSSEPGPRLLLGPLQSFPAAKAVQYQLKEKMVQNPVGFWWELIQTNTSFHRTFHWCLSDLFDPFLSVLHLKSRWLELCTTVGLGRADRGSPGCCFPLSCQNKVLLQRKWCNFTLCLNAI